VLEKQLIKIQFKQTTQDKTCGMLKVSIVATLLKELSRSNPLLQLPAEFRISANCNYPLEKRSFTTFRWPWAIKSQPVAQGKVE